MKRARVVIGGAIAGGIAMAATVASSPAVSQESPPRPVIDVEVDGATLGARGAVAYVTLQVTCPPGSQAFAGVELNQRSGNGIAYGFGDDELVCDGTIQEVTLAVLPADRPFRRGIAFARGLAQVCVFPVGCSIARDEEEIRIRRDTDRDAGAVAVAV